MKITQLQMFRYNLQRDAGKLHNGQFTHQKSFRRRHTENSENRSIHLLEIYLPGVLTALSLNLLMR